MISIAERVKAAFEAGRLSAPQARTLHDVPERYDLITTQWLTSVLCQKTPGSEVVSFDLGPRDDGSSNRRRIFLTYNDAGVRAGLPRSIFCKAAETLQTRMVLSLADVAENEMNFYNKARHRLAIAAPNAAYANVDPKTFASIIVMEDMTGKAQFCDAHTEVNWDRAAKMVTTLARLHSEFYASEELGTSSLPFKSWPAWWRKLEAASPTFVLACDRGFGAAECVIPPRLFRRRSEIWSCTEESVLRHELLPRTLIHSDVHLKNWFIAQNGEMGLSDWQITTVGHWSRDLIYAVATALTVENRRRWDRDLLELYLAQMVDHGVPQVSFDDAWSNCRQQLFSALAFWTVTLRPADDMPDMQPESATYEFIKRLATAIDDLDAIDSFRS